MADFNVIGESSCCGVSSTKILITYSYAVGSLVYDIEKAKKGILYRIAIKKVKINQDSYGDTVILYQDTLNGLWNEYDLCTGEEAQDLAINYLENEQAAILQQIADCG